ncbi:uncharacterized protein LOC126902193 [Daktulosphaira vitifoliae]|uniref:uncharacterized protein LOC126902193 n=1 Tax=Daktulosphaira vitifoliae TaxID=58002 RepID=UPI0021A9B63E|nr:uncharacterized protein LOC126902193 [Daktulosphaira vitifoliae]
MGSLWSQDSLFIPEDCGSQTNKLAEEMIAPIKSVTEINILESQIKEVENIAVQTSLLTSDKLTQTNNKLIYNVSETQTEMSLFNSLSCEIQTDVSLENLILNKKSLDEPHSSISKLINYMHTGSQCCLLSTKNEPLLKEDVSNDLSNAEVGVNKKCSFFMLDSYYQA